MKLNEALLRATNSFATNPQLIIQKGENSYEVVELNDKVAFVMLPGVHLPIPVTHSGVLRDMILKAADPGHFGKPDKVQGLKIKSRRA